MLDFCFDRERYGSNNKEAVFTEGIYSRFDPEGVLIWNFIPARKFSTYEKTYSYREDFFVDTLIAHWRAIDPNTTNYADVCGELVGRALCIARPVDLLACKYGDKIDAVAEDWVVIEDFVVRSVLLNTNPTQYDMYKGMHPDDSLDKWGW